MSTLFQLSRRSAIKSAVAAASVGLSATAHAFWPLVLRGLAFGGVRASTAARTAAGAGAATVAGRAYTAPTRSVASAPVLRQVQRGYRVVRLVDQFGRYLGEMHEPNYQLEQAPPTYEPQFTNVQLFLLAENTHPQCGQSFYSDFHLVSPQGQRVWAGGKGFCVPPGIHHLCFEMTGVPSGWQVIGNAFAGQNAIQTREIIYV